ncbi:unnamed protein product [Rotaria magnacalcarata]|uniref:Uncharacterized protein n=1 Tax=Rotaria magnacalcarata TaxID=392030 RepID=A0A816WUP1_9BILA|nr:unnamed protein product [Rotaria magnacalcarata]CAF2141997.1 unnamed protein product [Rotaria magnacalcarata]CAF3782884.1 unnamed protein product [Rotaria magnacalcarata]CAF3841620.1 unnamed protein product [Rotaria magnacalcarata]
MPKKFLKKITRAIRITFRLSFSKTSEYLITGFDIDSLGSEIMPDNDINKPNNCTLHSTLTHQMSRNDDYFDLRGYFSCSSLDSKDSGISLITLLDDKTDYRLESTPKFSNHSSSCECCQCPCHQYIDSDHFVNETKSHLFMRQKKQQKLIQNKDYPFIF